MPNENEGKLESFRLVHRHYRHHTRRADYFLIFNVIQSLSRKIAYEQVIEIAQPTIDDFARIVLR